MPTITHVYTMPAPTVAPVWDVANMCADFLARYQVRPTHIMLGRAVWEHRLFAAWRLRAYITHPALAYLSVYEDDRADLASFSQQHPDAPLAHPLVVLERLKGKLWSGNRHVYSRRV